MKTGSGDNASEPKTAAISPWTAPSHMSRSLYAFYLERVNALPRWNSRCAPSKDEHTDRGPKHEKGRDAHRHAAENRTRLLFHQLAARSDEENSDEEKRGQQPIYDSGPVESL